MFIQICWFCDAFHIRVVFPRKTMNWKNKNSSISDLWGDCVHGVCAGAGAAVMERCFRERELILQQLG